LVGYGWTCGPIMLPANFPPPVRHPEITVPALVWRVPEARITGCEPTGRKSPRTNLPRQKTELFTGGTPSVPPGAPNTKLCAPGKKHPRGSSPPRTPLAKHPPLPIVLPLHFWRAEKVKPSLLPQLFRPFFRSPTPEARSSAKTKRNGFKTPLPFPWVPARGRTGTFPRVCRRHPSTAARTFGPDRPRRNLIAGNDRFLVGNHPLWCKSRAGRRPAIKTSFALCRNPVLDPVRGPGFARSLPKAPASPQPAFAFSFSPSRAPNEARSDVNVPFCCNGSRPHCARGNLSPPRPDETPVPPPPGV